MKKVKFKSSSFGVHKGSVILDAVLLFSEGKFGLIYIEKKNKNCPVLIFVKQMNKYWIPTDRGCLNLDNNIDLEKLFINKQKIKKCSLKGAL